MGEHVKLILFSFAIALHAGASDYYVSTAGDDANDGSEANPWKTIQHAADTVVAGDTVHVRGGTYAEQISIAKSGSQQDGYITFQNYAGETPIIDGGSLTPGDSQSALILIQDRSYVKIRGFEICNFRTDSQASVPCGIFVTGHGSHLQIMDNTVHHIENNNVNKDGGNAHGIAVYATDGASSINNLTVSGNTVRDCKLGWSESMVLNGNVEIFTVSGNAVHDNDNIGIDLIGYEGTAPANDRVRNGTVSQNTVYNISSENNPAYSDLSAGGIYVDGGIDILIERNMIYTADIGLEVGCEHPNKTVERITVRNNIIFNCNVTGIGFGGYASNMGIVLDCTFQHNTLYMNDSRKGGYGEVMIQKSHDNDFSDNILYCNDQNIIITNYFTSTYSYSNGFDYNLYFGPGGSDACTFVWQNKEYAGFAAFQAASGQDAHSAFEYPDFADAASSPPNFRLKAGSPAIGAGNPAFAPAPGELDYYGNPRVIGGVNDVGAAEYGSAGTATLTMAVSPPSAGTVTPSAGDHSVDMGVAQDISATPAQGYIFVNWTTAGSVAVADPNAAATTATLSGNATVTANFAQQGAGTVLACGSVQEIDSADFQPDPFTKKPKPYGVLNQSYYSMPIVEKVNNDTPQSIIHAVWKKKLKIYDAGVYNRKVLLSPLLNPPISDRQFDQQGIVIDIDGTETSLAGTFYLANPTITGVTSGWAEPQSGDEFIVEGTYFGSAPPTIYVECTKGGDPQSPKYKKCRLNRSESYLFRDAFGKAAKSCMKIWNDDVGLEAVGYSQITVVYPRLGKTDQPTGHIILDNGVGLAAFQLQ